MCGTGSDRKADCEGRALPGLAIDLDPAVMPVNDPLRQAEAKTDAFDAARPGRVCSKETLKNVELGVRIDADARIANGESSDGTHARHVHDDTSAVRCEFDR